MENPLLCTVVLRLHKRFPLRFGCYYLVLKKSKSNEMRYKTQIRPEHYPDEFFISCKRLRRNTLEQGLKMFRSQLLLQISPS